jgi:hypothetical protein
MARAYAKHGFATLLIRLRLTRTLRVVPFVAETRNAGEHAGTFTFRELLPIHDSIIRQSRPRQACPDIDALCDTTPPQVSATRFQSRHQLSHRDLVYRADDSLETVSGVTGPGATSMV